MFFTNKYERYLYLLIKLTMQDKNIRRFIARYLPEIQTKLKESGKNLSLDEYSLLLREKIANDLKSDVNISDIKKYLKFLKNKKTKGVDEFIDKDGSFIKGDWVPTKREIFVGKNRPETSREFAMYTAQGPRYYYTPHYGASRVYTKESVAEGKMKNMIEDIISKNYYDRDMVNKNDDFDINEIPSISHLKTDHQRPIIARKTKYLSDMIEREGVSGEEISIILNHILSVVDVEKIPDNYKKLLINKLKNVKF